MCCSASLTYIYCANVHTPAPVCSVRCSVRQCTAVCCSVLQRVAHLYSLHKFSDASASLLQCIVVCGSVLHSAAVCCITSHIYIHRANFQTPTQALLPPRHVQTHCNVCKCVALCCSVLHYVAHIYSPRQFSDANASPSFAMSRADALGPAPTQSSSSSSFSSSMVLRRSPSNCCGCCSEDAV